VGETDAGEPADEDAGLPGGGSGSAPAEGPRDTDAVDGDEAAAPEPADDEDLEAGIADDVDLPSTRPAASGERIIRDGTVAVEIDAGDFDAAFADVVRAARRHGGHVTDSETHRSDSGAASGRVTVRVPVDDYDDLLTAVDDIGTTISRDIHAQDVTAEYTDLESRERNLEAQQRFYLELLDDAESVSDAIAVRQQLETIQGEIEQIRGRLRMLDDRTSFSTLTVELFEPGADRAPPPGVGADRPTLAGYWDTARDAFVNAVGALLVAAMFAVPLAVPVAGALLAWRIVRHPTRHATLEPKPE
jgi:hypothetical protein